MRLSTAGLKESSRVILVRLILIVKVILNSFFMLLVDKDPIFEYVLVLLFFLLGGLFVIYLKTFCDVIFCQNLVAESNSSWVGILIVVTVQS